VGDSDCDGEQFCNLVTAKCEQAKRPDGSICLHDGACQSGHCRAGFCVQCEADADCGSGGYCQALPVACKSKMASGSLCTRDAQSQSGTCQLTFLGLRCR
jgi:hypothetical protein